MRGKVCVLTVEGGHRMVKIKSQKGSYPGHVCRKFNYKYSLKRAGRDVTECEGCGAIRLRNPKGWAPLLGDLGVR